MYRLKLNCNVFNGWNGEIKHTETIFSKWYNNYNDIKAIISFLLQLSDVEFFDVYIDKNFDNDETHVYDYNIYV